MAAWRLFYHGEVCIVRDGRFCYHGDIPDGDMTMDWFQKSRLFELARQGKRLTHILAVAPLAFLFSFVAQFGSLPILVILALLYGLSENVLPLEDMSATESGIWMALFLISAFVLVYVFVGAWVWLFEKRPFWTLGYERRGALMRYGRGLLLGGLMIAVAAGILAAFGAIEVEEGDPSRQGIAAIPGVLIVLAGWIVQGGAEEVLTRGWILPVLGARYRPWVGLATASVLFAVLHGLNPGLSILAMVNLALFGLFAGLYALREGSLWGISALHSSWNWVQGNFLGFAVSGQAAGGGALLNLAGTGPDWLTGGEFGPEGGLAITAVLLVGIAMILWVRSKPAEAVIPDS
jgi:membrane protease YdiL (CAAX protease family)